MTPQRARQLASAFAFATDDLCDHLKKPGEARWTKGKWKGRESLIKHMISYGNGMEPKLTRAEVEEFVDMSPAQLADSFKN